MHPVSCKLQAVGCNMSPTESPLCNTEKRVEVEFRVTCAYPFKMGLFFIILYLA